MIDEAIFDSLQSLGDDFLGELADQFNEETEALLVQLRASFGAGETEAVGRIAHHLKGSAAQLGGRALASACDRVERDAAAGDPTVSAADLRAIELEYEKLRRSIAERLSPARSLS